jgi:hypothetical protein
MDVKDQIARLRRTADLLNKYPELGMDDKVGEVGSREAWFDGYPSDKLEDLLLFLRDNSIPFTLSSRPAPSTSIGIHIEGIAYWFTGSRIRDMDPRAAMVLFEGITDEHADLLNYFSGSRMEQAVTETMPAVD